MPAEPAILILTGASGAGKTTLVQALRRAPPPGVGCYHSDDAGIPSLEEMTERFGGPEQWQSAFAAEWLRRLQRNDDDVRVALLDGQLRPSELVRHLRALGVRRWQVALADCGHAERNRRLCGPRGQPELATGDMDCWAAYLRGQADALGLPVIDTSLALEESLAQLVALTAQLARADA